MKLVAKVFVVGITICLLCIYVTTLPKHQQFFRVQPSLQPPQAFPHNAFHDSSRSGNTFSDSSNIIKANNDQEVKDNQYHQNNDDGIYEDPYKNVKYFVDKTVLSTFNEDRYIRYSRHDADPMKLNSFNQDKSDKIGKMFVSSLVVPLRDNLKCHSA